MDCGLDSGRSLLGSSLSQVWLDVGGTFTDCLVRSPDGRLRHTKVLSSGLTKGRIAPGSPPGELWDPLRADDPADFWRSALLRVFGPGGDQLAVGRVVGSGRVAPTVAGGDSEEQVGDPQVDGRPLGRLLLDQALVSTRWPSGAFYELDTQLPAPVLAVRWLLGLAPESPLPQLQVRMGTTRGTNALLTRRGAATALLVTEGFEDLLRIGDQTRPDLFSLEIQRPDPLYRRVVGVRQRLAADGSVLEPLDVEQLDRDLDQLRQEGIESLAICLFHGYRYPEHERQVAERARRKGWRQVSLSSQVAPLIGWVARSETTLVDAYLEPVLRDYLQRLAELLGGAKILTMTSSGGLVAPPLFRGCDSVLSGPAGGVVAVRAAADRLDSRCAIGFDMGGTSTDVSWVGQQLPVVYESIKAGVRLMHPVLAIETVAAGGGSICWFDGVQLRVGPDSAGADPGPACYGRGGPLTVTDLNLWLGRLVPDAFPFPLDRKQAEARLEELAHQMRQAALSPPDLDRLAEGLWELAGEHMAEAIRSISVAHGEDPRQAVLVGFGGAAGQHICQLAERLGMRLALDPPLAGLLSAVGMGLADVIRQTVTGVYLSADRVEADQLEQQLQAVEQPARQSLVDEGIPLESIVCQRQWEVRYHGTDQSLLVDWTAVEGLAAAADAVHVRRFGYTRIGARLEVVAVRSRLVGPSRQGWPESPPWGDQSASRAGIEPQTTLSAATVAASSRQLLYCQGKWLEAQIYHRERLLPGESLMGPAVVVGQGNTTCLHPHWQATVGADGGLTLQHLSQADSDSLASRAQAERPTWGGDGGCDPVLREVLAHRLAAIAEQMGLVLAEAATSVNIKQRRDFSCAVFTPQGELLANAPHVPVHLGAMGATVREMLKRFPDMRPGDSFVTNDPYAGGSHLPDVTVVTPVFDPADGHRIFFTANRAHHAEIGGLAPGSMSPRSRQLEEEGVLIAPLMLRGDQASRYAPVRQLLSSGPYPSRSVEENLADLEAQLAANQRGAERLLELLASYGQATLVGYLEHILQASEQRLARWTERLANDSYRFEDYLDDGTRLVVQVERLPAGRLRFDFRGSGGLSPTNFNANRSIVTAATLYVLRCLMRDAWPMNEGAVRGIEWLIPPGVLDPAAAVQAAGAEHQPPAAWPAVAAGNVETSQRLVDLLLGAFGAAAASQGTMNNLLFGNRQFGFYETIGGGSGATELADGASAVHSHMTNTRLTDPEVLESRYPVRLVEFAVRVGSGGGGAHVGGDGIIRELQFLQPMQVSLITSRRGPYQPYGLAGGEPGQLGTNWRISADGEQRERLAACVELQLTAGERIRLETPGGGGFGLADSSGDS